MNVDIKYLTYLWGGELRSDQICEELGITRCHLYNLVRRHRLGRRPPRLTAKRNTETPDPTPEQIAERAAAIRATWSPQERRSRMAACYRSRPVVVQNFIFQREQYVFSR